MLSTHVPGASGLISTPVSLEETFEAPDELPKDSIDLDEGKPRETFDEVSDCSGPVTLEQVRFRKACFEVSNAEEFRAGIACGQATLVGKQQELTDDYLFALFDDLLRDLEISKPRLVGCVIGMVDALLRARQTLPPEFRVLLRALK